MSKVLKLEGHSADEIDEVADTPLAGDTTTYIGYSDRSGGQGVDEIFAIKRIEEISATSLTHITYPNGAIAFTHKWSDRAGLDYQIYKK